VKLDITEIAKLLAIRKQSGYSTTLVLGARAGAFYRQPRTFHEMIMAFSERSFEGLAAASAFGECYRVLNEHAFSERDLHSILRAAIQEVSIADADICLAELVKEEYFGEIITTNIDDLLEQAFNQVEMKEGQHYEVFIPGRNIGRHLLGSDKKLCRVTKVFGDLIARTYEIKRQRTYLDHQPELKAYLERVLSRDMLVIGLDPAWDAELIHLIPPGEDCGSAWFVDEDPPPAESAMARVFQSRQTQYLTGKEGNYERFFKALHWHLTSRTPSVYQDMQEILGSLRRINNEYRSMNRERRETREALQNVLSTVSLLHQKLDGRFEEWERRFRDVTAELSLLEEVVSEELRLMKEEIRALRTKLLSEN
jgi:hypothetical protein